VLLNQKLSPAAIAKDEDKHKLISILRTFFAGLKGWHVQYNIVSRETLLAARRNPEKYRDLVPDMPPAAQIAWIQKMNSSRS